MHRISWCALILAFFACVTSACSSSDSKPETLHNVVLITLDTTRADHLGCYGDVEAITPSLDALAAGGVVFDEAYAPSAMTLPSHATMLTGLNPNEHGLMLNNKASLSTDVQTMATILHERGYRTGAFIAALVLASKFGLNQGFDVYNDDMTEAITRTSFMVYRPADVVVDAAIEWVQKQPASTDGSTSASVKPPFFLWVHLYDPHRPYNTHADLDGTKFEGERTYDSEIAFMDRQIGRLLTALSAMQSSQGTLIIAVADHGEGLLEHGDPSHGLELYKESLRVPLIVSLPGVLPAGHRVGAVVSLRDLLPTVLDVLGLPTLEQSSGRSLQAALDGKPIDSQPSYAEAETPYDMYRWSPLRSLTTEAWNYIRSARPELYDRRVDKNEMYNLATVHPQRVAELEENLATYEATSHLVAKSDEVTLTEADRQRLAELGYITGREDVDDDELDLDLLELRDFKDGVKLRMWDWLIRWGVDEDTVDPATVAEVAIELVRASPETEGFRTMLASALQEMGKSLDEPLPQPNPAAIRARNEEPEKIVEPFRKDFDDPAKGAKAHIDAGTALAKRGFADLALGHLFEAAALEPDNALLHLYMAQIFRSLRRTPQTIAHLEKAIEIEPKNVGAQYNLALIYTEAKDYPKAAEHYRKALEGGPDNADALNNLGYVLLQEGKTREAEERLRAAMAANPSLAAAHVNLAELLVDTERPAEAITEYEQALKLAPTDSTATADFAVLLATCAEPTLRNPERALQLAMSSVEMTKHQSPGALLALARVHAAAGRYDAAIQAANEAMPRAIFSGREEFVAEIEDELKRFEAAAKG